MPSARVNGVRINYEEQGSGLPVVFIHGGFGGPQSTLTDVYSQRRVLHRLFPANRVQLITYDRRSSGDSEYVLDAYTLADLAADVRGLLAHLGIDRSVIVGDSMGGMVALQVALTYPEQVIALGLLETGTDLMSETTFGKQGQELVARAQTAGDRALFETRKDELRVPPPTPGADRYNPVMDERMQAQYADFVAVLAATSDEELFTYSTGVVRNYGAFIGNDLGPRLSEITMPACIIHGDADTTVPLAYAETLSQGIPHAEFHVISGATHRVLAFPNAGEALRDWVLHIAATTMP